MSLLARVESDARQAAITRRQQLAKSIEQAWPDAAVGISGDDVIVTGQALLRRWLLNAELRHMRGQP